MPYAMHAAIAVSSSSTCARKRPSQKRPETLSSLFPRRAVGSARHRMNHEMSLNRRRFSFNPRSVVANCVQFELRRLRRSSISVSPLGQVAGWHACFVCRKSQTGRFLAEYLRDRLWYRTIRRYGYWAKECKFEARVNEVLRPSRSDCLCRIVTPDTRSDYSASSCRELQRSG